MTRTRVTLCAIAALFPLPAAASDDVPAALMQCVDLEDDKSRLECYDRLTSADAVKSARESSPAPVPAAATLPDARAPTPGPSMTVEERFGLEAERERDADEEEPDQISARVSHIETRRNGERVFTLDNGQIWAEDSPRPTLRLEVGDTVTIKSGLFGSHRLFGSGNRSSGVDRVR